MRERRLENRFWCSDLVRVEWLDGENKPRAAEAVLEDIAAQGVCIQVEEPIPVRTAISISAWCNGMECKTDCTVLKFSGRVQHCQYREFGYFVGIRLSDDTKWSSEIFQPRHLTDLAALVNE